MREEQQGVIAAAMVRPRRLPALAPLLLVLLAGHFALLQLLTGVQYGDATRNLHWGLLTLEQPGFLLGAPDTYERVKGFMPTPSELAPMGLAARPPSGLHPWWGPATPLLFAAVWWLTRSYAALQLVIPLAAGAAVLLTYAAARRLLGPDRALVAAAFLSCYPLFRDYGTVSYNEALGALVLAGALFAYLGGRTAAAALLGALAMLTKLDLGGLYLGTVGICAAYDRLAGERSLPWRHHLVALLAPLALASPWIWQHYLGGGARGPSAGLSAGLFALVAPQMLALTFYIPWYGALLTLAAIGAAVAAGVRARALPPLATVMLGAWTGLCLLVVLVYCATPGAGNSPRIFIPALPALAILFAAGLPRLPAAWRRRVAFYLAVLFTLVNLVAAGYQTLTEGAPLRAAAPAFAALREGERGFVLTPRYWETILYARQPATWFEADPDFERNIMGDAGNFARYVATHPIRYVLLPAADSPAAPGVIAYLDAHARVRRLGGWTLWELES